MTFKPLVLVPVFNHPATIEAVVARLRQLDTDILLVDDGSDQVTARVLDEIAVPGHVSILRLPDNRGKGGAVRAGLEWAEEQGYTHALQVDADGQHDLDDAPHLLEMASHAPHCLVSGKPVYDDSVPRIRFLGRYLTHVWVWIETLSLSLKDSMCGFRVYPVDATLAVFREERVGERMDFDTEIMVRLYWRGVDSLFLPTRIRYPADGVSHFRMLADNWRITKMHVRLFFGMLRRLPRLLAGRRQAAQWHRMAERGNLLGMRMVAALAGVFGSRFAGRFLLPPIAGYFLLFHRRAREASRRYLHRVYTQLPEQERESFRPGWRNTYRHFLNFSREALVKLQVWKDSDALPPVHVNGTGVLQEYRRTGRGVLLVTAHLGNMEVSRALARNDPSLDIHALVYTRNARKFSRLMDELAPDFRNRLILVEEIGPDTIIYLRNIVERGGVVVIVGDRPPANDNGRVVSANFLGKPAAFAVGPYLLAHLMQCPVGLMFCLRENGGYRIDIEAFAERVELPRQDRESALSAYAEAYARRLETHTLRAPLQWFNFFDFWQESGNVAATADEVNHDDRHA